MFPIKLTKLFKFKLILAAICFGMAGLSLGLNYLQAQTNNNIYVVSIDDQSINPVTAEYIVEGIHRAQNDNAKALIIKLDTPGGLLTSTRQIVREMLASTVPIIVYVSPDGARAGSAGVFITYAAHIAAMSPSTNIGAAHPISLGGGAPSTPSKSIEKIVKKISEEVKKDDDTPDASPMESKVLNDTVAFIKSIAKTRNRNIDWAVNSVSKSESITAQEALDKGVINIIATDLNDLLAQLNGQVVHLDQEHQTTLDTSNVTVMGMEMDLRQKILNALADPNIAYIFLTLGFWALLYEVTHPGFGVPGIFGAIFLIIAFYSMQTLPVNYAGIALIALSVVLFGAEAMATGVGALALGGVISMVLGSLMLFDGDPSIYRVSFSIIAAITLTTAAITIFLIRSVVQSRKHKLFNGQEGLVGEKGEAMSYIAFDTQGKVFVQGTLWNAIADEPIKKLDKVQVMSVEGMTLKVKKIS